MPTLTLSGSTHLEDALITSGDPNSNFGAGFNCQVSQISTYESLFRVKTASFPAGTITGFRLFYYCWETPVSGPVSVYACRIKDANGTWVVGTANGSSQAGSCCYNFRAYNTNAWASAAGLSAVVAVSANNDDFYSTTEDASTPVVAVSAVGWQQWTLPASWATAFRGGVNAGILLRGLTAATPGIVSLSSIERDPVNPGPYVEIDYTTFSPFLVNRHRRRR